jgi:hypothetical protein
MADGRQAPQNLSLARDTGQRLGFAMMPILLLLLVPLGYSLYNLFSLGVSSTHSPYTFAPLVGSVLSALSLLVYAVGMTLGHRWLAGFNTVSGSIPYFFALYMMGFLGAYRLYQLRNRFSLGEMSIGVFWTLVGYAVLYLYRLFTETVAREVQMQERLSSEREKTVPDA